MKVNIITTLLILIVAFSSIGFTAAEINEPEEYFPEEGRLFVIFADYIVDNEIDFKRLLSYDNITIRENSITYGELSYLLKGIIEEMLPEKVRMTYNSIIIERKSDNEICATINMTVNVNTKAIIARFLGIKKPYLECNACFSFKTEGQIEVLSMVCDGKEVSAYFMEMASLYAFGHKDYESEINGFFDTIVKLFGCIERFSYDRVIFKE